MNDPEEVDETGSIESTEGVPDQDVRERLSQASTEQKLLEVRELHTEWYHTAGLIINGVFTETNALEQVLTDMFGRLTKERKTPSRLLCVGVLAAVKQQPEVLYPVTTARDDLAFC